jgi:hypothetical protein
MHLKALGFDNDEIRHRVVAYCPQVGRDWGCVLRLMLFAASQQVGMQREPLVTHAVFSTAVLDVTPRP